MKRTVKATATATRRTRAVLAATGAALCLVPPAAAIADSRAFNGRIAFSSFRAEPPPGGPRTGDIFTMNADGSDQRQLTANPADDAQPDWAPDGADIAYRIRKPGSAVNYEVARMTAAGADPVQITETATGQAASQPAWLPDRSGILFRRSGPGLVGSIWRAGPLGESPMPAYDPEGAQWYPSLSPDARRVLFATTTGPVGDADRGIFTLAADATDLRLVFDVPGAFDSAPAWSPDGTRIAFESNANPTGGNPEGDLEIWVVGADGSAATQLTSNAAHDEGPAWSPDGTLLAYTSGPDDRHGDIHVMTARGTHLRQLTSYEGRDESPDWQPIPAPATNSRCGSVVTSGPGVRNIRAARLHCRDARKLVAAWARAQRTARVRGFRARVTDFGGLRRVVLTSRKRVVAFLYQPPA